MSNTTLLIIAAISAIVYGFSSNKNDHPPQGWHQYNGVRTKMQNWKK